MTLRTICLLGILLMLAVACGEKPATEPSGKAGAKPEATANEPAKNYEPAPAVAMMPPVQTGETAGTGKVGEWTVGPELAPAESAVSDAMIEAFHSGDYQALDDATTVTVVRTAEDPGQKGSGDFALKVTRDVPGVSGVTSDGSRIVLKAGQRYLVRSKVNAGAQAGTYRIGVAGSDANIVWAKTPEGAETFDAPAGQWAEMTGVIDVPAGLDLQATLRIVREGKTAEAWYLDDVSVREILENQNP